MKYAFAVLPGARDNIREALNERDLGTRSALLAELGEVLGKIRERPHRYPVAYDEVHRALTTRFRFSIFFVIDEAPPKVTILGVLHQRRDPALWPKR